MSHFLRENEYQRSQAQQHCIYGHGNKTVIHKPKGLQQQQEIDNDFDGTNYPSTIINSKSGYRKVCDSGNATNTVKTATILVSKTKTKTGLPLIPKHTTN